MGFTIAGWSSQVPAGTTQIALTALQDEVLRVEGSNIIVPAQNLLIGYYAIGANIQNVQLVSPSMRRVALLDIAPIEPSTLPSFPPDWIVRADNPLVLVKDEKITAYAGNSDPANARQETILILLTDRPPTRVAGNPISVKATASVSGTAYAWETVPLNLTQTLPVGNYDIIGARCEFSHGIAFRLNCIGSVIRPGGICVSGPGDKDPDYQRFGGLGVWESFYHLNVPNIDILGDGTGGTAVVYLDLIPRLS